MGLKVSFDNLVKEKPTPFIAHWNQVYFVVVYKITNEKVWVTDPAHGKVIYEKEEFLKC